MDAVNARGPRVRFFGDTSDFGRCPLTNIKDLRDKKKCKNKIFVNTN